jgi:hypothetical protein
MLSELDVAFDTRTLRGSEPDVETSWRDKQLLVEEVTRVLDITRIPRSARSAAAHFVFTAGLAYFAYPEMVTQGFRVLLETSHVDTITSMDDTDGDFRQLVVDYVSLLEFDDARRFVEEMAVIAGDTLEGVELSWLPSLDDVPASDPTSTSDRTNEEGHQTTELSSVATMARSRPRFCAKCGTPLGVDANFCCGCGAQISRCVGSLV